VIVQVLVHHGFTEIPPGILLKRWTREAKAFGDPKLAAVISAQQATDLDFSGMHTLLYAAAMELVGLASTSRPAFEIGMQTLSRGKQTITSLTVVANAGPVAPAAAADALDADTGAHADLGGAAAPPRSCTATCSFLREACKVSHEVCCGKPWCHEGQGYQGRCGCSPVKETEADP